MSTAFCPEVSVFPPSPNCWFCANPAISTLLLTKNPCAAPHVGHLQSSGNLSNGNPGGTGYDGSPTASSYLYPQDLHSYTPVFNTANFSSSRRLSNVVSSSSGTGSGGSTEDVGGGDVGSSEVGLSSFDTSMEFLSSFETSMEFADNLMGFGEV